MCCRKSLSLALSSNSVQESKSRAFALLAPGQRENLGIRALISGGGAHREREIEAVVAAASGEANATATAAAAANSRDINSALGDGSEREIEARGAKAEGERALQIRD